MEQRNRSIKRQHDVFFLFIASHLTGVPEGEEVFAYTAIPSVYGESILIKKD
jgi:hypothetical protein